ncbi:ankyrin repeat domain-containing protein [Streptomyces sp. Go40/10]|uniref:HEAT repeat domain-containing protein n=1 Tax=Streptomyces sp. Go40/10 TaxID=2825844 RepID=UPI001E2CFDA6|nr:ankyrin repeat domain-containing protein [Streptomyces sp. Go40/10]UFR00302.1 ankyrin repeat domain-containing protein [Streptomyces sp. Go40/10]
MSTGAGTSGAVDGELPTDGELPLDGEPPLVAAARDGDTDLVRRLLLEGGDPDVCDARGTPVFWLAVEARSATVAQLLLDHGADAGRCGPDGPHPLRAAVDRGSPALVEVLLDSRVRARYSEQELLEMRDLARHWYETGVEAELRRRTGAGGSAGRVRVQDDEFNSVHELSLGGTTVRDGHAAILTRLEELLRIRAGFEELMGRALAHRDPDHTAWGSAAILLAHRRDEETWTAAAALRAHPDPVRRLFGAEVLRLTHLFDDSDEDVFAGPALDMFTDWSAEEADLAVLTEVLVALGEHPGPRAEAALLPHAGHRDARVRRAVAQGLSAWSSPPVFSGAARAALRELMTDKEAVVREDACLTVAVGRDRDPALADALAALLDDADRRVRAVAVYGLALHDDERCVEGARRLGPPRPDRPDEERYLGAAWRYEWRRDGR